MDHFCYHLIAVPTREELLPEIDLLRAVSLIAVAFIHTSAWFVAADVPATSGALPAAALFARFCVPAFIFCSGLALYRAYGRPAEPGRERAAERRTGRG